MKIERLDLMAYGSFTAKSLNLSDGNSGLHLIYGDNEAGKSTSLRALIAWLFGIPVRTNDNYLHSNPQLRIGGKLRLSGGQEIEFTRRKGTKGTLLEPASETVMDDSALTPFLPGGMDENLFKQLYGIDHGRLISGGEELLAQSGDLGRALFSAAVGAANFRPILSGLQDDARELFTPRASTKFVNQAMTSFKEAKKRIKDSSLSVAEWNRLKKGLQGALSNIQKMEQDIKEKNKEKSRLERVNRVKSTLAQRRETMAHIKTFKDTAPLPEDFDEQRKIATNKLQGAAESKTKAEDRLARLKEESAQLNVRDELLDNEEIILAIHKEWGAVEKAIQDRPQIDGKRRLLRNESKKLLKSVRPDLSINNSEPLRPLTNNKKWISSLAQKKRLLNQEKRNAKDTLRDVKDEQTTIKKKWSEQAESNLDIRELKAAVAAARKAGDLETRLARSQNRASNEKSACENGFSRLGRFSGTIKELSIAAMPMPETLDRFERRFDELSERIRDDDRRQKELKKEQRQAETELKALLLTSEAPTIQELEKTRSVRNSGWNLIKKKHIEKMDVEKEIEAFASGSDLTAFYEQTISAADMVSDRLRLSADQVVKRAELETKIETLKSRRNDIIKKLEKASKDEKSSQQEWNSIWTPLKVDAGTPREMKQWLLKVDRLLLSATAASVVSEDAKRLSDDCGALNESISLQISKFDNSMDLRDMPLEALINLCEQKIKKEEMALEQKRHLEHSLSDAENRIKKTHETLASIKNDHASWAREWSQAIDGLGLKPEVHPEQATEAFDRLLDFFDRFDKSEDSRRRIYGIDQFAEEFKNKVFEFSDHIHYKRDHQEPGVMAARLNRDLNEAREARASLKKIKAREKEITEEIDCARITIQATENQLALLRNQAGVEKNQDLEAAGERSRKNRELRHRLDALEQELTRNGDGLSIQKLEKEAGESDIDAIDGELERVSIELKERQTHRDTLRDQRQTLQNEMNAKNGGAAAASASEEAEQQLAAMVSGAERHLRLKIAALILKQRIEDYRKKNQAPVLSKAGDFFSKLTLGSYVNLRDELDKNGKPILLGVTPDALEVSVNGMSDGTRDQLYLSLRLATLEQHLSKGEPMPFIVDDILIGFDDHRTTACLKVLAELALKTQVLLFTHHRRALELAGAIQAEAGIFIHELS